MILKMYIRSELIGKNLKNGRRKPCGQIFLDLSQEIVHYHIKIILLNFII